MGSNNLGSFIMDKPWIKSYPVGVSPNIQTDEFSSLVDMFDKTCDQFAEKPAFTNFGRSITFTQLKTNVNSLASFLSNHLKLEKGDSVAIMMPNIFQYPICVFGILKAGLIVENINPLFTARELETQLKNSKSKAILILENFALSFSEIKENTSIEHVVITAMGDMLGAKGYLINFIIKNVKKMVPNYDLENSYQFKTVLKIGSGLKPPNTNIEKFDTAFLQYTGGTTGVVKAAMLTHDNILANAVQFKEWLGTNIKYGEEVAICALPLYHIFALTCNALVLFHVGANNILITNPKDINAFVKELQKHKFTFISGVNTLFQRLMDDKKFRKCNFSDLYLSLAGGMPVQKSVGEKWQKITGCVLTVGYGLSETSPAASIDPVDPINIKEFSDTIGLPLPSTEFSIQDTDGNKLDVEEVGEICIRGPQVMKGYWNNEEETKNVITPDGWFKTGDVGYMRGDGYFKIVDRIKDVIIISGFNIYPSEIEEVVLKHEKIFEAACVGIQNKDGSESIKLFLSLKPGEVLTNDEIIEYCRSQLTAYKVPKMIEFIEEIPKSNVGKILRRELRERVNHA